MFLTYIILILICICFIHNEKIVSFELKDENFKYSVYPIFSNQGNITFTAYINTILPFSVFNDYHDLVSLLKANWIKTERIHLIENFDVSHYKTSFEIQNIPIIDYSLYLSTDIIQYYPDQGIGLAYKFEDNSFSIVHNLYKRNIIEHLTFTIESHRENKNASIHFGYIDMDFNSKFKGVLNVNDDIKYWGSMLNGITFNNTYYEMNSYSIINTCINDLFYSDEIFDFVFNVILSDYIKDGICYKNTTDIGLSYLICKQKIKEYNNDLLFLFGTTQIKLKVSNLFKSSYGGLVNSNPYYPYRNKTIIGIHLLKMMNYTLFDYENKEIVFYSDNIEMINVKEYSIQSLRIITVLCSIICILNIIVLIIINK